MTEKLMFLIWLKWGKWLFKLFDCKIDYVWWQQEWNRYALKCYDGDFVCGTFFQPDNRDDEPYIRIATGNYLTDLEKFGRDEALA